MQNIVTQLQPREITYRGHTIRLTHRPKVNDWLYEIIHTRSITLSSHAPRYDTAVKLAKSDIDALIGPSA